MISSATKVALAGVGLTGVVGGGIGIYCFNNKEIKKDLEEKTNNQTKSVKVHLSELKKEIPAKEAENTKWSKPWGVFKAKYQTGSLPTNWAIAGWDNLKGSEHAPNEFKDKCIENGNKEIMDTTKGLFVEVRDYCSIDKEAIK